MRHSSIRFGEDTKGSTAVLRSANTTIKSNERRRPVPMNTVGLSAVVLGDYASGLLAPIPHAKCRADSGRTGIPVE